MKIKITGCFSRGAGVTGSTIAMLNNTCGNLVQLVALEKLAG